MKQYVDSSCTEYLFFADALSLTSTRSGTKFAPTSCRLLSTSVFQWSANKLIITDNTIYNLIEWIQFAIYVIL